MPPNASPSRLAQIHALFAEDKTEQARAMCQRLLQSSPNDGPANFLMSAILLRLDQAPAAVFYAERAAKLLPQEGAAHARVATLQLQLNKLGAALAAAAAARRCEPGSLSHRALEATILSSLGRHSEALDCCRINGEIPTENPELGSIAGGALISSARPDEAVAFYRRLAAAHPNNLNVLGSLCSAMMYAPDVPASEVFDAHVRFGEAAERIHPRRAGALDDPDPDRRLRLGFISPDLHQHPVTRFLLPLLEHLDRTQFEIVLIDTGSGRGDQVTQTLKRLANVWRHFGTMTWREFADRVHGERIDVLVELSGHTLFNSLELTPYRPAGVHVTYLGYPFSTGLPSMDYRIVDGFTDPAPRADSLATERLVRIDPCFLCYQPPADAPEVSPLPAIRKGHITFGSFNSAQKLSRPLIAMWSSLLRRSPNSRLVLKALGFKDEPVRANVAAMFGAEGVEPARVCVLAPDPSAAHHLSRYAEIDIGLDPFPYQGTTTTCEALLMGVPVVTIAGDRHAARVGVSLLNAVGLSEFIAPSAEAFVEHAAAIAGDVPRLTDLRTHLRSRLLASALCDAPAHARRFGAAMRQVWREAVSREASQT